MYSLSFLHYSAVFFALLCGIYVFISYLLLFGMLSVIVDALLIDVNVHSAMVCLYFVIFKIVSLLY